MNATEQRVIEKLKEAKGWTTAKAISQTCELSRDRVTHYCRKLLKEGAVKRREYTRQNAGYNQQKVVEWRWI